MIVGVRYACLLHDPVEAILAALRHLIQAHRTDLITQMDALLDRTMLMALLETSKLTPPIQGFTEASDNDCLHRMSYYMEKIWKTYTSNQQRLAEGKELIVSKSSLFQWRSRPVHTQLRCPFVKYASIRGPPPDEFKATDLYQTLDEVERDQLRHAYTASNTPSTAVSSTSSRGSDDFDTARQDAWATWQKEFPENEQFMRVAKGQFDYSFFTCFLPWCEMDNSLSLFDVLLVTGQDFFQGFEFKFPPDILGNYSQWEDERDRMGCHPADPEQKTLVIVGSPDGQFLPSTHRQMLGTIQSNLFVKNMMPVVTCGSFLEGVTYLYQMMYSLTDYIPLYQQVVSKHLDRNTSAHIKSHFAHKAKPSENRATPEYRLAMWLHSLCGRVPENVVHYLFARFRSAHQMTKEMDLMTPIQRVQCLRCIPGLGAVLAEQLAERICPSAMTLFESEEERQRRQSILSEMPTTKKEYTEEKFYPMGKDGVTSSSSMSPPGALPPPESSATTVTKKRVAPPLPPRKRKQKPVMAAPVAATQEDEWIPLPPEEELDLLPPPPQARKKGKPASRWDEFDENLFPETDD